MSDEQTEEVTVHEGGHAESHDAHHDAGSGGYSKTLTGSAYDILGIWTARNDGGGSLEENETYHGDETVTRGHHGEPALQTRATLPSPGGT